jgi:putative tryptophan/tyrosine transport system substrate-binding protein
MKFDQLKRRDFIALLSSVAAAWPLAAHAQQMKLHRLGALFVGNADSDSFRAELRQEIRKSGYVEGQNVWFSSSDRQKRSSIDFPSSRLN